MAEERRDSADMALRTETIKFRTAVVVGVVAIIGALVGILPARQAATTAQGQADTSQAEARVLTQQNKDLQTRLTEMQTSLKEAQATIAELSADASNPTNPDPTPTGTEPIWHEGRVVIPQSDGADLDAAPDDNTWGQAAHRGVLLTNGGPYDIWYRGSNIVTDPIRRQAVSVTGAVTYASCQTSGYTSSFTISIEELRLNKQHICVMTDKGQIAAMTYVESSKTKKTVTFDVVTWQAQ